MPYAMPLLDDQPDPFDFTLDEEMDGLTPGESTAAPAEEPKPGVREPYRNPFEPRMRTALEAVAIHKSNKPSLSDEKYKPGILRRLGAAGASFANSYINMGGRTRTAPGAVDKLNNELLRPGYSKDVQRWEDEGVGREAQLEGAKTAYGLEDAAQHARVRERTADSAIAENEAQRGYYEAAAEKARRAPARQRYMNTSQGAFDSESGQYVPPPPKPEAALRNPFDTMMRGDEEARGKANAYLDAEAKRRQRVRGAGGGGRGGATEKRDPDLNPAIAIEARKNAALRTAEDAHLKAVNEALPAERKAIEQSSNAALQRRKAQIQADYENEIRAGGGSVVPRGTGGEAPPPPAPPPAASAPRPRRPLGSFVRRPR